MDFQVVVLAGGFSKTLVPLVSKEVPKALLPVANRPVLSYILELLEQNNLKDLIVVVESESAALPIGNWISSTYVDRLHVEVAAVPEDSGTAGAIRAIYHHLTATDILVVSGDLVCEIPPGAVAAAHRRHNAVVTAMLCSAPVSGPTDSGSAGGKDKAKKPGLYNIIGLDPTKQFLLHVDAGGGAERDVRVQKNILRGVGQMEICADLMDAHMYAFKRSVLQEVLNQHKTFHSLRRDVLPYLVKTQLSSELSFNGVDSEEYGNENDALPNGNWRRKSAFGYTFSAQNNLIHPSVVLGTKTTVGPHCMVWEGSQMGDKCSVKKSVIGRHCRIGSNVKIVNSVIMNHVTIGDGCSIQGSVICSNVQLQERVVLKDCQIGAGYIVTGGSEHKGESLARKEK